jgi:hypothetical protein
MRDDLAETLHFSVQALNVFVETFGYLKECLGRVRLGRLRRGEKPETLVERFFETDGLQGRKLKRRDRRS